MRLINRSTTALGFSKNLKQNLKKSCCIFEELFPVHRSYLSYDRSMCPSTRVFRHLAVVSELGASSSLKTIINLILFSFCLIQPC